MDNVNTSVIIHMILITVSVIHDINYFLISMDVLVCI